MYELITLQTTPECRMQMDDEELKRVIEFVLTHDNNVTLREIKRGTLSIDDIEQKMETWVQMGVISRHHGRYRVKAALISQETQKAVINSYSEFYKKMIEKNSLTEMNLDIKYLSFYILYSLTQTLIYQEKEFFVIENSKDLAIHSFPIYFQKLHGKKTEWVSFESFDSLNQCKSLPTYFYDVTYRKNTTSKRFLALEKLLGDVNIPYFLSYSERKLRRIEKGRSISSNQSDIFLEALSILNYLTIDNDLYQMNICLINQDTKEHVASFIKKIIESFEYHFKTEFDFLAMIILLNELKSEGLFTNEKVLFGFETL